MSFWDVIRDEKLRRRLKMGVNTLTDRARQGFFIPYRYADTVALPGSLPAYPAIEAVFTANRAAFDASLAKLLRQSENLRAIAVDAPAPAPRWGQSWFPGLDAAMAFSMVREDKPGRVIEIGTGHSTRFMAAAAVGQDTEIIAIDPAPRATLLDLPVEWHREVVGPQHLSLFESLLPGDICFIDSSHILMPGTDVDFLFNRVLPRLQPGVIIHIHDMLLPHDYPPQWGWRGYNEQQAVIPMLTGGGYSPLFSSVWAREKLAEGLADTGLLDLHIEDGAMETSLWLKKTGPAL